MTAQLQVPERRWECPNCDRTHVDRKADTTVPYHPCPGLHGLSAPFVQAGVRSKVQAVERGDWVGKEHVQTDGEGRPVMAIVTTTDTGQDCAVLAPVASGRQE
jgi:hypothetical protein